MWMLSSFVTSLCSQTNILEVGTNVWERIFDDRRLVWGALSLLDDSTDNSMPFESQGTCNYDMRDVDFESSLVAHAVTHCDHCSFRSCMPPASFQDDHKRYSYSIRRFMLMLSSFCNKLTR